MSAKNVKQKGGSLRSNPGSLRSNSGSINNPSLTSLGIKKVPNYLRPTLSSLKWDTENQVPSNQSSSNNPPSSSSSSSSSPSSKYPPLPPSYSQPLDFPEEEAVYAKVTKTTSPELRLVYFKKKVEKKSHNDNLLKKTLLIFFF